MASRSRRAAGLDAAHPAARLAHQPEAVAADAVHVRIDDRDGGRHGHHRLDGVAALGQHRPAGLGGEVMGRGDGRGVKTGVSGMAILWCRGRRVRRARGSCKDPASAGLRPHRLPAFVTQTHRCPHPRRRLDPSATGRLWAVLRPRDRERSRRPTSFSTMLIFEWVVGVLFGAVLLAGLARRLGAPYPAFLALGGVGLAFVPGVPNLRLDPELALALFLAPVLLDAGFDASVRDMKADWRAVLGLAVGAVAVTTLAVAVVAKLIVPDMPLAACIVLGAVVAPPDAVAALAVLKHAPMPHRLATILRGESLLNDAASLLIYRLAVAAAMAGSFHPAEVAPAFLIGVVASLAAGPCLGLLFVRSRGGHRPGERDRDRSSSWPSGSGWPPSAWRCRASSRSSATR